MQLLTLFESKSVIGGVNPTIGHIALFALSVGAIGESIIGDIGAGLLFAMLGFSISMLFIAVNDEEFLAFWELNAIEMRVF